MSDREIKLGEQRIGRKSRSRQADNIYTGVHTLANFKMPYATLKSRIFASFIDVTLVAISYFVALYFFDFLRLEYVQFLSSKGLDQIFAPDDLKMMVTGSVCVVAYIFFIALPTILFGRSTGKIFSGIYVGSSEDTVASSFGSRIVRECFYKPISIISIIGILMILFSGSRRGLHDVLAKTSIYNINE